MFDQAAVDSLMEESIKMKSFDHPNVLGLIGVCIDAGPAPYIVIPYMSDGSLLNYLKHNRNRFVVDMSAEEDEVGRDKKKKIKIIYTFCFFYRWLKYNGSCCPCVYRLLVGWSTLPSKNLFIEILLHETACN